MLAEIWAPVAYGGWFFGPAPGAGILRVDPSDFRSKHPLGGGCARGCIGRRVWLGDELPSHRDGSDCSIGTPELKVGLFPMMIAPVLMRRIPRAVLHEMILCGLRLSANDALRMGVINRVSDPGEARSSGMELAMSAAQNSRAIVGLGLNAMRNIEGLPLERSLEILNSQLSMNLLTEDAAEGITAFLQRRTPEWKGR